VAAAPCLGGFPRVLLQIRFLPRVVSCRHAGGQDQSGFLLGSKTNWAGLGLPWLPLYRGLCFMDRVEEASVIADFRCLLEALRSVAPGMHDEHFRSKLRRRTEVRKAQVACSATPRLHRFKQRGQHRLLFPGFSETSLPSLQHGGGEPACPAFLSVSRFLHLQVSPATSVGHVVQTEPSPQRAATRVRLLLHRQPAGCCGEE